MGRRDIVLLALLVFISISSSAEGNIFSSIRSLFTSHESNQNSDVAQRRKRITSDEGIKAAGLENHGFKRSRSVENEAIVKRNVNQELEKIWSLGLKVNDKKTRSLSEEDLNAAGKTKILEQRATLRVKSNEDDDNTKGIKRSKSLFENINSREEKEMSSIRTVSSVSVPANEGSASGDEDDIPLTEVTVWPKGRYGLPKSIFGCPETFGVHWKTGFRYHDTEDDGTENQRSDLFHLAANFSEDGISHEFCIKDDVQGEGNWPSGKYCIYKRGPNCPKGLKQGFVIWDDENTDNQNDKGGALPEGEYTEDTKIFFCCSLTGAVENQISLPAKKPFFLFAYESIKCQKVLNMKATSEFIKFDDEDHGNTDHESGEYPYGIHKFQKDHMLFLCYYVPNREVKSHNFEYALTTNLEEDSNDEIDQESIRQSEQIMKEFMKATGGVEDESGKKERTKTIIKTIKVPVRNKSSPIAMAIGLVMGSLTIGTMIIFITKIVSNKQALVKSSNEKLCCKHAKVTWTPSHFQNFPDDKEDQDEEDGESVASDVSEKSSPSVYTPLVNDSWSDLEEDDELVEDQLLPDSELKSGLELLFLKQQRHYWNQKNRHERHNYSH